ncbi:MAG TPA: hypothetical protein VFN61_12160, partial [Acidimicrobiales bacterium]|nr:hypothetical protein [Acidimicrobiales bacterium]
EPRPPAKNGVVLGAHGSTLMGSPLSMPGLPWSGLPWSGSGLPWSGLCRLAATTGPSVPVEPGKLTGGGRDRERPPGAG